MFTQLAQAEVIHKQRLQFPIILAVTLLAGAVLGRLFTFIWPQLPALAAISMWPLGTAMAMIVVALTSFHLRQEPLWSFAIVGQLLAVTAVALIFLDVVV